MTNATDDSTIPRLSPKEWRIAELALRVATEVYKKDALETRMQIGIKIAAMTAIAGDTATEAFERVAREFDRQAEQAEALRSRIESAIE